MGEGEKKKMAFSKEVEALLGSLGDDSVFSLYEDMGVMGIV